MLFANGCTGTRKTTSPRILNYNYTQHGKGVAVSQPYTMPPVCKNVVRNGTHPKM